MMEGRLARAIESREWSPRSLFPLRRVLVSSPIPTTEADAAARAVSLGGVPAPGQRDVSGLDWTIADRGEDGFPLGEDVPAGSSVLLAVPIERLTGFDPFVRVSVGSFSPKGTKASMYVGGEPLWDNFEKRPIDFANPPMLETSALVVMRLDAGVAGAVRAGMGLNVPENAVRLPLEERVLGDDPDRFAKAP